MALSAPAFKSVGLIIAVAFVGVIVVFATVASKNRTKTATDSSTKPFLEPTSGVVFDGLQSWTIGSTSESSIQTHAYRLASVPTQRTACSELSPELSKSLQTSLKTGLAQATTQWQQEFPGLVATQILKGPATLYALVGIDTCNLSLTVRSITFRGQAYKNNVELQLSQTIEQDSALNPTELSQLAQDLADGTAIADVQQQFNQFVTALGSVR